MRKQIARLTSNILSPPFTAIISILLVSFESTTSLFDAIKWALTAIALSILPLSLAIVYLVRTKRLDSVFANIRNQRTGYIWVYQPLVENKPSRCHHHSPSNGSGYFVWLYGYNKCSANSSNGLGKGRITVSLTR